MSRPAYYGRPALVAPYRPPHTPASVVMVALLQYLGSLLTLVAAGVATLVVRGVARNPAVDRVPEPIRRGIAGGGPVIPVTLAVLGVVWLVIAHHLLGGRPWARYTMLMLSLLGFAGTLYEAWLSHDRRVVAAATLPLLFLALLNTEGARRWFGESVR